MTLSKKKRHHDKGKLFLLERLDREKYRRLMLLCSTFLRAFVASIIVIFIYSNVRWQVNSVSKYLYGTSSVCDTEEHPPGDPSEWHNLLVNESHTYVDTLKDKLLLHSQNNYSGSCHGARPTTIALEGLPEPQNGAVVFSADRKHKFTLVAYEENGTRRCSGGDYFEADFYDVKNVTYKARLPIRDYGNGSYGLELIVPSRFAGSFVLDIFLLFGNWHGLDYVGKKFNQTVVDDVPLLNQTFLITRNESGARFGNKTPPLKQCDQDDFDRTTWHGRWTRSWFNESCGPDEEKRYRCLPKDRFDCEEPWCFGPVGNLESNGWSYSAHCGFKLFTAEEAWKCLNGKWILAWGDSNFSDTLRNLLLFILDWKIPRNATISGFTLPRSFDTSFENPANSSESLRITAVFNGHHDWWEDYEGLYSLTYEEHQKTLLQHFSEERKPDAVLMTSGLHDMWKSHTLEEYVVALDFAVSWWSDLYNNLPLEQRPTMVWKTTIATGGKQRRWNANPNKSDMWNLVTVERFHQARDVLPMKVIDAFDLTFPFHYNNDYSDGGHYGRAPGYYFEPWYGEPHWYFVDVMLANIFLNAICPTS